MARERQYYVSPPLLRALRAAHPDVVHVQGIHCALGPLALFVAERERLPTVLTFHTGGSSMRLRHKLRHLQWRSEAPLMRRASALVAVCEFEIDLFGQALGLPSSRFTLIRNGSEALPASEEPAQECGSPLVLSVGRLERYKGHHRVIAAMPALLDRAPAARLVVVGSGPFERSLRSQASRLGLDDVVAFRSYGPSERAQMGTLIRSSNVVTLMSEYEAHPVAVMEALAEGVPVVVAATSGLRELGRAGLVELAELDEPPQTLAERLIRAAQLGGREKSKVALPSWSDCALSLASLYRRSVESA